MNYFLILIHATFKAITSSKLPLNDNLSQIFDTITVKQTHINKIRLNNLKLNLITVI